MGFFDKDDFEERQDSLNDSMQKFKTELLAGEMTKQKKIGLGIAGAIVFYGIAYFAGFFVSLGERSIFDTPKMPWLYFPFRGIFSIKGWLIIAVLSLILFVAIKLVFRKNKDLASIKDTDGRGVNFSADGTYGTAEWMGKEEARKAFETGNISQVRGNILCQFGENGDEVCCLPMKDGANNNILILGAPGRGKSFSYVRNAIYQTAKRKQTLVVTDPKGELYRDTVYSLQKMGYKVLVYNMLDPKRSDAWDCVGEIYDPNTGNISPIRALEFVDIVMKNSADGEKEDFWSKGESNLFKALLLFCAWNRETNLFALFEHYGNQCLGLLEGTVNEEMLKRPRYIIENVTDKDITMNEKEQALRILLKLRYGPEEASKRLKDIKNEAPACNISTIYRMLVMEDIKEIADKFKNVPDSNEAISSWNTFNKSGDNVKPGIIQGLAQRLQIFQTEDVRRIACNDGIVLKDLGKEKTALFCIISDNNTSMRLLTSLFFSFLFKDVAEYADNIHDGSNIAVNVIADEFANLGVIPGFPSVISTARGRKVNISVILQGIKQLNSKYGDDDAQTIISCCDTILYLGCNDEETADFISNYSGVASIRVLSTRDSRTTSLGNRAAFAGYSLSEGDGKRQLLNPDEARKIRPPEILVYHNGFNMLKAKTCGYIHHPYYHRDGQFTVPLSSYPLTKDKYKESIFRDAFYQADIENVKTKNQHVIEKENQARLSEEYARNLQEAAKEKRRDNRPSGNKNYGSNERIEFVSADGGKPVRYQVASKNEGTPKENIKPLSNNEEAMFDFDDADLF